MNCGWCLFLVLTTSARVCDSNSPFGQIPAKEKEKVAAVEKIKNGQHVSGWEER
ncbi:hypothetical protein MTO96_038077, partial [Rhipicephalus appendiculatus]